MVHFKGSKDKDFVDRLKLSLRSQTHLNVHREIF